MYNIDKYEIEKLNRKIGYISEWLQDISTMCKGDNYCKPLIDGIIKYIKEN